MNRTTKKDLQDTLDRQEADLTSARENLSIAYRQIESLQQSLLDTQATINSLSTELKVAGADAVAAREDAEQAHQARDAATARIRREHKRSAAVNKRNAELQKALRTSDLARRKLQIRIDMDQVHYRRLQVVSEQLALVREVANMSNDDWLARADDVPVEKLLTGSY